MIQKIKSWFKSEPEEPKKPKIHFWFSDHGCLPGDEFSRVPLVHELVQCTVKSWEPGSWYIVTEVRHKFRSSSNYYGVREVHADEIEVILKRKVQ